jgi:hypothetical protein
MIADRVSDAVAVVSAQISAISLPLPVNVALVFGLLREVTAKEDRQRAVQSETLLRTGSSWDGEPYSSQGRAIRWYRGKI